MKSITKVLFSLVYLSLTIISTLQAQPIELVDNENLGRIHIDTSALTNLDILDFQVRIEDVKGNVTILEKDIDARYLANTDYKLLITTSTYQSSIKFDLKPNETKRFKLSALKINSDYSVFDIDFGQAPSLELVCNEISVATRIYNQKDNVKVVHEINSKYVPTLAADCSIFSSEMISRIQQINFKIKEGEVLDVDLKIPDLRSTLVINSATKYLPDMFNLERNNTHIYVVTRDPEFNNIDESKKSYKYPFSLYNDVAKMEKFLSSSMVSTDKELKYFSKMDNSDEHLFELVVNNTWMRLPKHSNPQIVSINLKRIDLNDITVTQEDGTQYKVKAEYRLYHRLQDINNLSVLMEVLPISDIAWTNYIYAPNNVLAFTQEFYSSGSGVSVTPGVYKLKVNYITKEGPKLQDIDLDLN